MDIVRQQTSRLGVTTRHSTKASRQNHLDRIQSWVVTNVYRSLVNYVWAQVSKNAPVSIGHWSLITFECTESTSAPVGIPKNVPSVISIHQWTLLLPLSTVSLHQWEFSIYSSFGHSFQPRSLLRNAGINAGDMGRHMDMALISSLNREIASASPVNHNEATSGSVKV